VISYSEIESFALSDYALEEKIVNIIDPQGRQILVESVSQFLSYDRCAFKIQSMEKYNSTIFNMCTGWAKQHKHYGPVTCHAFRAYADSASFPLHTDPDDVILVVVEGMKYIEMEGKQYALTPNSPLFIPANTPHRAINTHDSLMLSFGLEKFMIDKVGNELDPLPKNN
jgi:mannose-6-phosphate isomerase-like protein (cupin superfamily)